MQIKIDAGNLICSITDHLMNFILLETITKHTKDCPFVRLFTKHRIRQYHENAACDQPLLPEISNNEPENVQIAFSEFIKNFKKLLDK